MVPHEAEKLVYGKDHLWAEWRPIEREKIFTNYTPDRGLLSITYKGLFKN